jgi:hypothetical protein
MFVLVNLVVILKSAFSGITGSGTEKPAISSAK